MVASLNTSQSGKAGRNYGYSDFLPMLNSTSVKTRFLVSVGANLIRSLIGFFSGMLVARGLGPSNYGDLAFLIGSFSSILSLLDMGASNAFYTFLSRRSRGFLFFAVYFFWVGFQFSITLLFVAVIIPDYLFQKIWLGHDRGIVIIALLVVFMQQQVWQIVNQIGESMRKTVKVQLMNICVSLVYIMGVITLMTLESLSLRSLMLLMLSQYILVTSIAYFVLSRNNITSSENDTSVKQIINEYWHYGKPLMMLSLFVFLYNFADKWLLQRFGGSIQQGYFQISNQFATVSLLATTSILSVFWKEIAHAWENKDLLRVERLYRKVSRGLVMLGAIISGLLIPWAEQIVKLVLGVSYSTAWPVLAVMLLYPIHQSMGQIGGTMLLARGLTKIHMYITVGTISISLPITYLLLAPSDNFGFNMGALGIALKMVILGVISVNIQAWIISRISGWQFDWMFQAVGIPIVVTIGYMVNLLVGQIWNLNDISIENLFIPVVLNSVLYTILVFWAIWLLPWLVGLEKKDVKHLIRSIIDRVKSMKSGLGMR